MKYYYHPGSPNCRKVSAFIHLADLDVEWSLVDLPKGAHMAPEYAAVNPNCMVPAFVDGDLTLWESNAIMIHLAEKTESPLWSDDTRLEILQWLFWEQSHFMYATGTAFFQVVLKPMIGLGEPDPVRVEEAIKKFRRYARVLDDRLSQADFVVEDRLTLADLALASQLTFAGPSGLPMEEFPNIMRWLARLDKIEAWKKTEPSFG
ncbi:MAG: glutathione S-transferase family protein [bacterium]|nr:glutathione S-transferase family protein [bacterium]